MRSKAFIFFVLAACTQSRGGGLNLPVTEGRDAGPIVHQVEDAAVVASCDCTEDEVCVDNRCEALPATCPCPLESYCDLGTNTCVAGCTSDALCNEGRICFKDERECRNGCRSDGGCGAGEICEELQCRAGCRADTDCGAGSYCDRSTLVCVDGCDSDTDCGRGSICQRLHCVAGCRGDTGCDSGEVCEDLHCQDGCRTDAACGAGALCSESFECVTCDVDSEETTESTITCSGRTGGGSVERVLCGPTDSDVVAWETRNHTDAYTREAISINISGATIDAVTTISGRHPYGGTSTIECVGNGYCSILDSSFDYACSTDGSYPPRCAVYNWTDTYTITTTSRTPVSYTFSANYFSTRGGL